MTIEERKLTPAGQGNLQQIKLGIPVVEALNRMAEDPMGENEKLLLRILEQNKDTEYGRKYGFANIHSIEEYQKKVPVSVYDDYAGYILRMSEDGEEGKIDGAGDFRIFRSIMVPTVWVWSQKNSEKTGSTDGICPLRNPLQRSST